MLANLVKTTASMPHRNMRAPDPEIGTVFTRLTVLSVFAVVKGHRKCVVRCECGKESVVSKENLTSGHTKSCGCLSAELARERRTTHGLTNSRAYSAWESMLMRCQNPARPNYADYGGRNIKVCADWQRFAGFYADMGEPPGCDPQLPAPWSV